MQPACGCCGRSDLFFCCVCAKGGMDSSPPPPPQLPLAAVFPFEKCLSGHLYTTTHPPQQPRCSLLPQTHCMNGGKETWKDGGREREGGRGHVSFPTDDMYGARRRPRPRGGGRSAHRRTDGRPDGRTSGTGFGWRPPPSASRTETRIKVYMKQQRRLPCPARFQIRGGGGM